MRAKISFRHTTNSFMMMMSTTANGSENFLNLFSFIATLTSRAAILLKSLFLFVFIPFKISMYYWLNDENVEKRYSIKIVCFIRYSVSMDCEVKWIEQILPFNRWLPDDGHDDDDDDVGSLDGSGSHNNRVACDWIRRKLEALTEKFFHWIIGLLIISTPPENNNQSIKEKKRMKRKTWKIFHEKKLEGEKLVKFHPSFNTLDSFNVTKFD